LPRPIWPGGGLGDLPKGVDCQEALDDYIGYRHGGQNQPLDIGWAQGVNINLQFEILL
jgi:hypothetical protein